MNGCPIAPTQRDLTIKQRVFLEAVTIEIIHEERDFQIRLMGGKTERQLRQNKDTSKVKHPDDLVAAGLGPKRRK